MWGKRLMVIAWPAFLVAAVLEMVVFALVDPGDLHWFGAPLALSREAVYTLAFFVFWGLTMASSALRSAGSDIATVTLLSVRLTASAR